MGRRPWILKRAMKTTEECDSVHLGLSKGMRKTLRLTCSLCTEDYKDSKVIWRIRVSCTLYENASFLFLVVSHLEIHPLSLSHKMCGVMENRVCGWSALTRILVSYHSYKGHQKDWWVRKLSFPIARPWHTLFILCTNVQGKVRIWVWCFWIFVFLFRDEIKTHTDCKAVRKLFKAKWQCRLEMKGLKSLDNCSGFF